MSGDAPDGADQVSFALPDLGEGLTEAEVVAWLVAVGDRVGVDQPVARVETAKAVVEVPIPFEGVVAALHASPGEAVPVGAPLLSVTRAPVPTPGTGGGSGPVLVGSGAVDEPPPRAGRRHRRPPPDRGGDRPPVVSPVVRRLARDHGLDPGALAGSGPGGLVTRRDVEEAIESREAQPQEPAADGDGRRVPLTGSFRAMADRLARSRREVPEATVWVDVDATGLVEARASLAGADPDARIGVLSLLARFCVAGLARHPELNATFDTAREEIVQFSQVHLGIAAQGAQGLVVPVVRHAERRTTAELAREVDRLTEGARSGSLAPAELAGSTFTINNYGVYGVDGSAAIINYPEAAILGLGRIVDRPWVVEGALAVRKVTQLTLAFDHRVCDGRAAGQFLRFVANCVESPLAALAHL